jgi:hypothetical protein
MKPVIAVSKSITSRLIQHQSLGQKLSSFLKSGSFREYSMVIGLNVAMTVLKTIMHGKAYEHENFPESDRKLLYVQEWVRQSVSTALWLTSLITSFVVIKKLLPNQSQMGRVLLTNLVSSVPDAFVRPFLTAKIAKHFLKDDLNQNAQSPPVKESILPLIKPVFNPNLGFKAATIHRPMPVQAYSQQQVYFNPPAYPLYARYY